MERWIMLLLAIVLELFGIGVWVLACWFGWSIAKERTTLFYGFVLLGTFGTYWMAYLCVVRGLSIMFLGWTYYPDEVVLLAAPFSLVNTAIAIALANYYIKRQLAKKAE